MSIKSSSQTLRRYQVEGELPDNFSKNMLENIEKFSFKEIEEGNVKEISIGWVSIDNPYILPLMDNSYDKNDYIVMSMRIDRKTIPARTLKSFIIKEEQKRLRGLNRERLSYNEKKDIRESVYLKLLQQALPASGVYDFFWNLSNSSLFFFASGESINNKFIELFEQTFQIRLKKMSPLGIALNHDIPKEKIMNLKENSFSE